ncbi:methyltransferase domain-containing protein [Pseudalkalibacillus salsuginis]|uniref:methyltransferase domain-containing protein n=1 Tax=Pseudalkalibacillus salsuginis TaxID=2910972 RepID=UPI001F21C293|nr:methyltransferase domain-containing protein [Pseudalkalibacillus salsuginis]MCF6410758.1 class I SAM-dependent methyltransferase [Pseudalkalibacillus salsuginis]
MNFRKDLSNTTLDEIKKRQLVRFPLVKEWIEFVGIKNGDTVLDIGPGPGTFTLQYSNIVGEKGKIIAFEKSEEVTEYLKAELQKESIYNVEVQIGDAEKHIGVDKDKINIVMLTDILHHAESPYQIMKNIHSLTISKKVKILISEFDPNAEGVIGPPLINRIDMEVMKNWAAELDFGILKEGKQNFEHYFILLESQSPVLH